MPVISISRPRKTKSGIESSTGWLMPASMRDSSTETRDVGGQARDSRASPGRRRRRSACRRAPRWPANADEEHQQVERCRDRGAPARAETARRRRRAAPATPTSIRPGRAAGAAAAAARAASARCPTGMADARQRHRDVDGGQADDLLVLHVVDRRARGAGEEQRRCRAPPRPRGGPAPAARSG